MNHKPSFEINNEEAGMAEYTDAMSVKELQDGQMKGIELKGKNILIARVDEQFYAASNICPHMKGRLSGGSLKGTVVTCPRHASQFDLKDGHVVRWTRFSGVALKLNNVLRSPRPLQVFPVLVEGDRVMVNIETGG
jgi:3-phenylpropionate/trans-cinnamate dioxygenase ferredoxin subunit